MALETANTLKVGIGTKGTINLDGLDVAVLVRDMRQRWGVVDALIVPMQGAGEKWVEARRITVVDTQWSQKVNVLLGRG